MHVAFSDQLGSATLSSDTIWTFGRSYTTGLFGTTNNSWTPNGSVSTTWLLKQTAQGAYGVRNNGIPSGYWNYCVSSSRDHCTDGGFDANKVGQCSIIDVLDVQGHKVEVSNTIPIQPKYEFQLQFTAGRTIYHGARTLQCPYNGNGTLSLDSALTVYDIAPVISSIQQDAPATPVGPFYVTISGTNFGPYVGAVVACAHSAASPAPACATGQPFSPISITQPSPPDHPAPPPGAPLASWSDTRVKVLVTPSASASGLTKPKATEKPLRSKA